FLARKARPSSLERRTEEEIGPRFKGDGRVRDERCRGMTRFWVTDSPVPPTLLARKARPSSLEGGPKKRSVPLDGDMRAES
ncbi:MAG: hypothetical protein O3B42_09100, partial [Actinomycetota bacterium]|nr:hypothetical protein [Actinomycetota bacterium]